MKKSIVTLSILVSAFFYAQEAFSMNLDVGARLNKPVRPFKEIKNQNVVNQSLDYSCGPASLATLLSYYFQDKVTEGQIIKSLILTTDLEKIKKKKGFSLLDLKNFAKLKGYEVAGYKMDLEYLVSLNKPVLIQIEIKKYNHFVIFRGLRGDRVFISDPALGNMTMRVERFLNLWKGGIGLVLSRSDKKNLNSPLALTDQEKAIFADPAMVKRILGTDSIGKIYADGEF